MKGFGHSISTYNKTVDRLNHEYETAKRRHFGVTADTDGTTDDMSAKEKKTTHDAAVDAADHALRVKLGAQEATARRQLDDDGQTFADTLTTGPTQEAFLSLSLAGFINIKDALPYIGMGLAEFNKVRGHISTVRTVLKPSTYRNYVNLAKWLKIVATGGERLKQGIEVQSTWMMRDIMRSSLEKGLNFSERIDRWKAGKDDLPDLIKDIKRSRGQFMADAWNPDKWNDPLGKGAFFSESGKIGSLLSKAKPLGVANTVAGRAMGPLALAGGIYTLADTGVNWDHESTEDKVTGIVGGGSSVVAGGIATAALVGVTVPPVGAAIAIGAGAVALGTVVYQHRHQIAHAAEHLAEGAKDLADDVGSGIKDGVSKLGGLFG